MALESLELGTMFGLGMAINDGDETTPGQKGWGGLGAHALVFGKSPEQTALVTLGIGGSSGDIVFLSAISNDLNTFSFRANDKGTSIVDPATATLVIDGQPATLVASPGGVGATDFTHTFAEPYPSGSEHPFTIELRDTNGNVITETSSFSAFTFATITPEMQASQIATNKPGFTWRIFQNETYTHNSIAEAELALIGQLVDGGGIPVTENNASNQPPFGPAMGTAHRGGARNAPRVRDSDGDQPEFRRWRNGWQLSAQTTRCPVSPGSTSAQMAPTQKSSLLSSFRQGLSRWG